MARSNDSNPNQQIKAEVRTRPRPSIEDKRAAHRREIEEILRNAAKPAEAQLVMSLKATITREDIAQLPPPGEKQNPKLAHKLYYKTLGRLRRRYLLHNRYIVVPENARKDINKEIRDFLKKGEREGDSRMAETKRMAEAINVFVDWMNDHHERETAALYHMFCDANSGQKKG